MEIFFSLFLKLIPLYLIILMGYLSGKYLKAQKETLASLLIYIIAPVIIFHGLFSATLNFGLILLPVIFFVLGSAVCVIFYVSTKSLFKNNTRNILAFASGTGNTGYFGLPVAISLFGVQVLPVVALIVVGMILYENTVGFFITARGQHTVRESIYKIIKLPALYAFILGLVFNLLKINPGAVYLDSIILFRGAYTVLGMMLIGIALSEVSGIIIDRAFICMTFLAKFIVWPVLMLLIIYIDSEFLNLFDGLTRRVMFLLAIVPIAANSVSYATLLKVQPQKAAVAVLLSTLFALFYIPLLVSLYL